MHQTYIATMKDRHTLTEMCKFAIIVGMASASFVSFCFLIWYMWLSYMKHPFSVGCKIQWLSSTIVSFLDHILFLETKGWHLLPLYWQIDIPSDSPFTGWARNFHDRPTSSLTLLKKHIIRLTSPPALFRCLLYLRLDIALFPGSP